MTLTTIQRQVLADIAAGRSVAGEPLRASAITSLKKRGLIVLSNSGKWQVTLSGQQALAGN